MDVVWTGRPKSGRRAYFWWILGMKLYQNHIEGEFKPFQRVPEIHNLDPEGLDPYSKEKPTWAMVKYATYTLSRIDPWSERSVTVQRRIERPLEASRPAPRRPPGPRQRRLIKPPEGPTSRSNQDCLTGRRWHMEAGPGQTA